MPMMRVVSRCPDNLAFQTALDEPFHVSHRILCTRKEDQIRVAQLPFVCHVAQGHAVDQLKHAEIRKVGNVRQTDDRHINAFGEGALVETVGQAVLIIHINLFHREDTQHRFAGQIFQHLKARLQYLHIAPELIDDDTAETVLVFLRQQLDGAVGGSKDAAPVDVRHQDDRRIRHFCHAHVDDIVFRQVDLRRGAGALDDNDVIFRRQMLKCLHDFRREVVFHLIVFLGAQVIIDLAVYNDLRTHIAGGL